MKYPVLEKNRVRSHQYRDRAARAKGEVASQFHVHKAFEKEVSPPPINAP